jgi:Type I restriction-modification system methyltransferase subunit
MTAAQLTNLEDTLWKSADNLRANSDLKSTEYATPVLGLIFLRFADNKYGRFEKEIQGEFKKLQGTRREKPIDEIALAKCGLYLPPEARYANLLGLPEKANIADALKTAMQRIEEYQPSLAGCLPKDEYFKIVRKPEQRLILKQLLKNFADIPEDADGDSFGQIYEYFLGSFAKAEGQGGGEFFTPRSVVRLMVEMIEPFDGTVYDPACGSGGMFVQSARFVEEQRGARKSGELVVYGQEKALETVHLAKMNLAINNLRGDIKQANSYYEDPYGSLGKFDYVLANPPFNVDDVNLSKVETDKRFNTYGVPRNKTDAKKKDKGAVTVPNANYLWISLFATSLKPKGRAALVMANSASDARNSEADIRKSLVEAGLIAGMLSLPSNMFYTVTLPATLWFFDRSGADGKILFVDARNVFTQIDRAHREFSEEQIQDLATIGRLRRGEHLEFVRLVDGYFASGFASLGENRPALLDVAGRVTDYLKANDGERLPDYKALLKQGDKLAAAYEKHKAELDLDKVDAANKAQRKLAEAVGPFFASLHVLLKEIDKEVRQVEKAGAGKKDRELKLLKEELEALHAEVKATEYFFNHVSWLQERFPEARYCDVTGLCKLATKDEVREQDYSLNPGRYVGVVVEEDGKTEEEFLAELLQMNEELSALNAEARKLEKIIEKNVRAIAGEE